MLEKTNEATHPITNKLPDNWDDIFKNHHELPPEEFQFSIGNYEKFGEKHQLYKLERWKKTGTLDIMNNISEYVTLV